LQRSPRPCRKPHPRSGRDLGWAGATRPSSRAADKLQPRIRRVPHPVRMASSRCWARVYDATGTSKRPSSHPQQQAGRRSEIWTASARRAFVEYRSSPSSGFKMAAAIPASYHHGRPAGIGRTHPGRADWPAELVVLGDARLLASRACGSGADGDRGVHARARRRIPTRRIVVAHLPLRRRGARSARPAQRTWWSSCSARPVRAAKGWFDALVTAPSTGASTTRIPSRSHRVPGPANGRKPR
jgi:hypothetical protein